MFLYLSKFLPPLIYPLGLAFLLIIISLIAKKPNWKRAFLIVALVILYLGSNHWVAIGLARSLEWRHLPEGDLPRADVIVLLSGGTVSASEPRPFVEINQAGDRLIYTAYLYQQGKADHILLSGGAIDWLSADSNPTQDTLEMLELFGVPRQAIWLEPTSRNTYENAVNSKKILDSKGIQRILLVTSASHMPRSVSLFESQGLDVIPAPTDFVVSQGELEQMRSTWLHTQLLYLFPSADNLAITTRMLKEYFGLIIYSLRGWI